MDLVTNYLSAEELKKEFREYKLKVLSNEINFQSLLCTNPNTGKHKDLLHFISDTFPNDIITGSLSLSLFGLIKRDANDIDIIIDDKDRYKKYDKSYYDDFSTPNRLGYRDFKYKRNIFSSESSYTVDFFLNDSNASFITFEFDKKQIKIHNPLEVIDYKLNIAISPKVDRSTSRKHNEDLTRIFGQSSWQLI